MRALIKIYPVIYGYVADTVVEKKYILFFLKKIR